MGEVRFTSEVAAPLGEVFAAHVDGARIPEWFPGVRAIEDLVEPLDRAGATYRLRFNRVIAGRCEVVSVDPPRFHARTWDSRPLGSCGKATMRLPSGDIATRDRRLQGFRRAALDSVSAS